MLISLDTFLRGARESQLTFRQDSILVVLTWIIAPLISTIPMALSLELPFTLAFLKWLVAGLQQA
ncbi:hypothetical protein AZF37_03635 [endosymbiont 'TC1' of Trimyema compressum]|uniref:hypothetical protein n=1 Tax=endosymbiont 'TC1' of Trimyema compressum TaxID=243899 RepID=UPI0007F178D2|nr:hypothetical protein [endosymbiont 'TC1' of Trimyema compressum]AMP20380.1 hypothetical protein AZF37_03635 [endosymbiont 'TC1' of Trimyema compressum]